MRKIFSQIPVLTSFEQFSILLKQGKMTCEAMVQQCLANIAQGQQLNAFIRVYTDEAKQKAKALDRDLSKAQEMKLTGMVVGLKDLICYQDHPVQAASKILEGFVAQFSATAVQRLTEQHAIIVGHQNCDSFGMGSSNEHSTFGPVHNALDTTRTPGGSSGGSAVAVQAHMCHVSLGTDTGGSVRQPAAFCGVVGLKPTYGRISRHGMIAYASSFDTIGILARNIKDCATVLEVISGPDEFDSTVAHRQVPNYDKHIFQVNNIKVAYFPAALAHTSLQSEIRIHTQQLLNTLQDQGHTVTAVDFPLLDYVLPTYYTLTSAEASANLARFDGIRYGYRSTQSDDIISMYQKTRSEGFGDEVKRRILMGTCVLSAGYQDAWYVKAQKIRRRIKEMLTTLLTTHHFIILPTTPTTAFKLGTIQQDPMTAYLGDLYTVLASIAGLPAISIPNGTDKQGLPIGLQVIAPAFQEQDLLSFSDYLTQFCVDK